MEKTERTRRRVRFHHLALAGIAVALLAGPISAFASDDFPDVPNDHPFHDEIGWLAGTGITTGFPDGTFKPGQAVTRQSMAAFMQRFYNMQAGLTAVVTDDDGPSADTNEGTWTNVGSVTLVVPPGTTGRVIVSFNGHGLCNGGANIFALFFAIRPKCEARILMGPTGGIAGPANPGVVTLMDSDDAALDPDNIFDTESFSMTGVSGPSVSGSYTGTVQINHDDNGTVDDIVTWDVGAYTIEGHVALNDAPVL